MYIHATIPECDGCGERFTPAIKGFAIIARGATGRHCEVLWLCPSCVHPDAPAAAISKDEARERIGKDPEWPHDWADF